MLSPVGSSRRNSTAPRHHFCTCCCTRINGTPLLCGSHRIARNRRCMVVCADIIGLAYFMLMRYEEIMWRDVRDVHGRFMGKESLAFRAGYLHRPIVDEYASLRQGWLKEVGIDASPVKRDFSVAVTHDTDVSWRYPSLWHDWRSALRQAATCMLGRHRMKEFLASCAVDLGLRADPHDTFDMMMIGLDDELRSAASAPRVEVIYFLLVNVRYADDFVMGFQHRLEAARFLNDLQGRFAKFGLALHADKTHLIECGRFAAENRKRRGDRKPETFDFLGFTHICGKKHGKEGFVVKRQTMAKRLRAKLREVKATLMRCRHAPISQQGRCLRGVVQGYLNYHAIPGNMAALEAFRTQAVRHWLFALRRRSQRNRVSWE